jgi:hypothetical protein
MLTERQIEQVLSALHGLALADWSDFCRSPSLVKAYERNLRDSLHLYVADRITCGRLDCWSRYKDLVSRYPYPQHIQLDCEDFACAHAAYMARSCYGPIYVGLVPGARVSHAVCGVGDSSSPDNVKLVDPCLWAGMPPVPYDGVRWKLLKR